jgi:hypothetical protein
VAKPTTFHKVVAAAASGGLAAAALFFAPYAPSANAAGQVHVDPGSPSGKEYALPVPRARRDAAGGGSSAGTSDPPLFGQGVSSAAAAGGSSSAGKGHGNGGSSAGEGLKQVALVSDDSYPAKGTVAVLALAVVLLGAGIGLAVRRLRGSAA